MKLLGLLKFDLYRFGLLGLDALGLWAATWLGYSFVFEGNIPSAFSAQMPFVLMHVMFAVFSVFAFLGVYSRRWPQFGERDARQIILGTILGFSLAYGSALFFPIIYWPFLILFWAIVFSARAGLGIYASYRGVFFPLWQIVAVPLISGFFAMVIVHLQEVRFTLPPADLPVSKTIHALAFFMALSFFMGMRWGIHRWYWRVRRPGPKRERVLLIGNELDLLMFLRLNDMSQGFHIMGILDHDPLKWGVRVRDVRILGGISLLKPVTQELSIEGVIVLQNSLSYEEGLVVEKSCRELGLKIRRMGSAQENLLRGDSLSTADLLERQEYRYLPTAQENYLQGKRILVTGAGGSIGSELVRQILQCSPRQVVLLGRGENSIFELERELEFISKTIEIRTCIVNIVDYVGLKNAFELYMPQIVFHAAAHKHVPLMESAPREALQNNVLGTWNVAELCGKLKVERMVMVSTDKAVAPKSVMGATKRKAESVVWQMAQQYEQTRFAVVRFGNVLGSRGSVVRLFMDQIRKGGPVLVTDPRMTRYFMTIPEAVSLVLASAPLAQEFGIFVLDMGKPYRIYDLAEKMIRLCGLEPGRDIRIEISGVRPGEKIDEILVDQGENLIPTNLSQVQKLVQENLPSEFSKDYLENMLSTDNHAIRNFLGVHS